MAVELFAGFKRTAQAGGKTTEAKWEDLTVTLKRVMYAMAFDVLKAQAHWANNLGVEVVELSTEVDKALLPLNVQRLMENPL